jgi:hypothetical protein
MTGPSMLVANVWLFFGGNYGKHCLHMAGRSALGMIPAQGPPSLRTSVATLPAVQSSWATFFTHQDTQITDATNKDPVSCVKQCRPLLLSGGTTDVPRDKQ